MPRYTANEVETAITPLLEEDEEFEGGWDALRYNLRHGRNTITLRGEAVPFSVEAEHGGSGQGEEAYVVIRIGDQLFKKDGYYASHYGYDWDGDFEEVEAREQTIIVYDRKGH